MKKIISIQLINKTQFSMLTLVRYEDWGFLCNEIKSAYCIALFDDNKCIELLTFADTGRSLTYRFQATFWHFFFSERDFFSYRSPGERDVPRLPVPPSKKKCKISDTPQPKPSGPFRVNTDEHIQIGI
jgi:hypothetical protein